MPIRECCRDIAVYVHTVDHDGTIEPHADRHDHGADGLTAGPGSPCMAWSKNSNGPCPKVAAVSLLTRLTLGSPSDGHPVTLCGSHYDQHRRGNRLQLEGRGKRA